MFLGSQEMAEYLAEWTAADYTNEQICDIIQRVLEDIVHINIPRKIQHNYKNDIIMCH